MWENNTLAATQKPSTYIFIYSYFYDNHLFFFTFTTQVCIFKHYI